MTENTDIPHTQPTGHAPGTESLVRKRRLMSPLTRRILALNVLALAILVGGLLYLGEYRKSLIETKLAALQTQGEIFAAALGEGAVASGFADRPHLVPILANQMMRRLVEPTGVRARLFNVEGALLADSLLLSGAGRTVYRRDLPEDEGRFQSWLNGFFDRIDGLFFFTNEPFSGNELPLYSELEIPEAVDFDEVMSALQGESARALRSDGEEGKIILSIAVPVQYYKEVMGAVLLSRSGEDILATLRSIRFDILRMFAMTLAVTVLLSIYLAGTIVRPIHLLAEAAERVRHHHDRHVEIPDFTAQGNEIGDLSGAFRDMTAALWRRMDAIESFAADVAHEIKNPLTSLRSAVETAAGVTDPEKQRKLLAVILDDVQRIDRLISDISDASRLDAELSRATRSPVDVAGLLATLSDMHNTTSGDGKPVLTVETESGTGMEVPAIEGRLVQVFRNLITNAISFSPPGGSIICRITRKSGGDGDFVIVTIEDQGPGIPKNKHEAIFERFYTERPEGEKFGIHSGLGLSISRQIVEAHGSTLRAENLTDEAGVVCGACFTVRLSRE